MTSLTPSAGHALGLPALTRRSLLRASPVLSAPGLLASAALASSSTDTAVLRLFSQWDAENARLDGLAIPEHEFDDAMAAQHALEQRIRAEPSTGLLDLIAKVVASSWYGDFPVEADVLAECEAMLSGGLA